MSGYELSRMTIILHFFSFYHLPTLLIEEGYLSQIRNLFRNGTALALFRMTRTGNLRIAKVVSKKEKIRKSVSNKKQRNPLKITYEILPPGSLRKNICNSCSAKTSTDRWDEIIDICAEVILED